MKEIRELLRDADPLQYERTWPSGQRAFCREEVLAAASASGALAGEGGPSRSVLFAVVGLLLMVITASFVGARVWSLFVGDLQAAVLFEVRLAEDSPAPGLREAKVSGSDRSVYLHDKVIVTNSDIATARVVEGSGPSQYGLNIEFTASGAQKMREATGNHIGKPLAILIDGQVVMAPKLRSTISGFAVVTGNYTRTQAERIVNGMGIR